MMQTSFTFSGVAPTSIKAYREEVEPTLGARQAQVLAVLAGRSMTNGEIGAALGWTPNRVTPRVHELRQLGRVEYHETRPCSVTLRTAMAWRVRP